MRIFYSPTVRGPGVRALEVGGALSPGLAGCWRAGEIFFLAGADLAGFFLDRTKRAAKRSLLDDPFFLGLMNSRRRRLLR